MGRYYVGELLSALHGWLRQDTVSGIKKREELSISPFLVKKSLYFLVSVE